MFFRIVNLLKTLIKEIIMITENQYKILQMCKDNPQLLDEEFEAEYSYLATNDYLIAEEFQTRRGWRNRYKTSKNKGLLPIQEYEDRLASIQKESRSLQIAEESNRIAAGANQIAQEANTKSEKANYISIWAIAISGILSIATFVASVLIALFIR